MKKQVAIIGAGPAGLVAAKSCIEAGLSPVIFEKSSSIGGVWSGSDGGLAWDGMHTNISKWSCVFSDFPWPLATQDFPLQSEVASYLKDYADAFGVTQHIQFQSEVLKVQKASGAWTVTLNDRTEKFDAVIIASGFFAKPTQPDIRGAKKFEGQIIHSSQCRKSDINLYGNITVYGGSLSGYELAVEFSRAAKGPVTHAFKRASWVLDRYVDMGDGTKMPLDLVSYSRESGSLAHTQSPEIGRQNTINFFRDTFGNPGNVHADLSVSEDPSRPNFVVISDGYLNAVREGKIIPVLGDINRFDQRHLVLNPQRSLPADTVVMATGYRAALPYLGAEIKRDIGYDEADQFMPVLLSETVWPKNNDGLAFVGFYRGPFFGIMELQARWAAGVFAGEINAPSHSDIEKGIQNVTYLKSSFPRPQFPYEDYEYLADTLAKRVGCYPDLDVSDPLYKTVQEGFFSTAHFRLTGKYSNRANAEKAIGDIPCLK